jgi:maleate isomerase
MARKRIGLLVPAGDTVIEVDLGRHFTTDITVHTARMYMEKTTVEGELKMLEQEVDPAARRIAQIEPELAVFGCTSAGALLGLAGERNLVQRIENIVHCKCLTVTRAVIDQLKKRKPNSIMILTPYIPEVNTKLEATLKEAGLPIVYIAGMGYDSDLKIGNTEPEEIIDFTMKHFRKVSADSLFLSCTTLRAAEVVPRLEMDLGVPVLTSNTATIASVEELMA